MKIQSAKAGIGTGRAGLQAASGLFSSAGLFSKGVTTFDPLALNPYAFFDGESYKGTLENPTLDLDPSNPDSLDVITATRAGVATYTDASGNIATASADTVRVDHTQGEQLTPTVYQRVNYTDFSSGWTANDVSKQSGNGYLSEPSAIITVDSTSSAKYYYFLDAGTYNYDTVYTGSFFIRRVSGNPDVYIDNFRSTSSESLSISLTDDWQKIEFTFTSPSDYWTRFGIVFGANNSSVGDQVEISQPQVEEGTTASSFVANTTGSPKFITGATYGPRVPMILVEPSATNLFRNSQDLTASPNSISKATITQESETFKGQPVFRLTDDTSSGEHRLSIIPASVTASRVIVHFFVKADTCTKFCITYPTAGDAGAAWNLQSGSALGSTVGSAVAQTIEDAGDGWFKVSMTYDRPTATATGHNIQTLQDSATSAANRNYQGDGTLSFLMTMPQLEYGETQTSFIPTSGSAVTRAADDLVISGSDFDFYNQSEGTFYIEDIPRVVNSTQIARFSLNDGTNVTSMYSLVSGAYDLLVKANGSANSYNVGGTTIVPNQLERVAFSYITDEIKVSRDGALNNPANNPSTQAIPTVDRLHIGQIDGFTRNLNGRIRRLIFWPYHSENL